MGAQPFLKRGQIKLMPANFGVAVEQQRHLPAVFLLEKRIGIHINGRQAMSGTRNQFANSRFHILA